jgi:Tfp pilus assembly protein PilX
MNTPNFHIIRNEKGIVLLIALMVLIMLTLMGLAAVLTGTTDVQIAANESHSTQALYLAEAGVGQVKSWFENPASFSPPAGSYTLDANNSMGIYTFPQQFFSKRRTDVHGAPNYLNSANLSQFTDINNSGSIDSNDANNANDDGKPTDQNTARTGDHPVLSIKAPPETGGTAAADTYLNDPATGLFKALAGMGRVTVLEVYPPMLNTNFAIVRVKAVDAVGATRTIEQEIGPSLNFAVTAAVMSGGAAGWGGNAAIHWGNIDVNGNATGGNLETKAQDQWWGLHATGTVSGVTLPDPNYNITQNDPTANPQFLSQAQKTALQQYAQSIGESYVYCSTDNLLHLTNGSGTPVGAGIGLQSLIQGKALPLLYVTVGPVSPTCNPTALATAPTYSMSGGGGFYTDSNIILDGGGLPGGGLSVQGLGGGTTIMAQDPGEVAAGQAGTNSLGVHFNGLVYTTGTWDSHGNNVVYGAVLAEGGYTANGTPDVWYNANLAYGLPGFTQTTTQGWREIRK